MTERTYTETEVQAIRAAALREAARRSEWLGGWKCVNGHDACSQMYAGPECPYCEKKLGGKEAILALIDQPAEDAMNALIGAAHLDIAEWLDRSIEKRGPDDYRFGHKGYSNGVDACYDALRTRTPADALAALGKATADAFEKGKRVERERCAKIADDIADQTKPVNDRDRLGYERAEMAKFIAAAIRGESDE